MPVTPKVVHPDKCLHCGACVGACPENAIFLRETYIEFLPHCTHCKLCIRMCPVGAITGQEEVE